MKTAVAVLCSSVALVAGAAAARAHTTHTPTTIVANFVGPVSPSKSAAFGYLQTPPRCRGDRRVKVFFRYGSDTAWTLVDVGKSSGQGAWGGIGPQVGPSGSVAEIKVRVTRENIGRHGHKHICDADSLIAAIRGGCAVGNAHEAHSFSLCGVTRRSYGRPFAARTLPLPREILRGRCRRRTWRSCGRSLTLSPVAITRPRSTDRPRVLQGRRSGPPDPE